jgi:hypothetical protein
LLEDTKTHFETIATQKELIEKLKLDLKKSQVEKETLRKNYFKELMVHRNAETAKKTKELGGGAIDVENRISVVFFDGLEGLD